MSIFMNIQRLLFLIRFSEFDAQVTSLGIEILDNNVDWLRQNPHDYWIGGVHLHPGNDWRWNAERKNFNKRTEFCVKGTFPSWLRHAPSSQV